MVKGVTGVTDEIEAFTKRISLEHILIFATGASSIPPAGFNIKPRVQFVNLSSDEFTSGGRRLCSANTCSCTLFLVVLEEKEYEQFVIWFITSLMNGKDFSSI